MQPRKSTDSVQCSPFYVPPIVDLLGGLVHHFRPFFLALGKLESSLLADELRTVPVRMPMYVCGMPRSGSTLLHGILARCAGVCTHRVKDYPMVFTPYWWRRATAGVPASMPRERPHQDRVLITSHSPEALDEMLWVPFFPRCHDPTVSNVLSAQERNPAFENFYRLHLGKLLLAERAARYVAKNNYLVARLPYLCRLFPDVKIVLPVRHPVGHIGSLVRQHSLFSRAQRRHPRALALMRRSGHFEFGRDRRPVHLGRGDLMEQVLDAWARGDEIRGWALYWTMVHSYLAQLLATDPHVRAAVRTVRFEDLCVSPAAVLAKILEHCELPASESVVSRLSESVAAPDDHPTSFTPAQLAVIDEETRVAAQQWGYGVQSPSGQSGR